MSDNDPTGEVNQDNADTGDTVDEKTVSQSDLNRILKDRLSRQKTSLAKEFESKKAEHIESFLVDHGLDVEELEALKEQRESGKKGDVELRKLRSELAKLQSEVAKQSETAGKFKSLYSKRIVSDGIEQLASNIGNSSKSQSQTLVKLLENRVQVEDGEAVVLDESGEVAHETSLEQLVKETLDANPFLKGASGSSGSGGRPPSNEGKNGASEDLSTKSARIAKLQELLR